jgi:hypothetical protein
VDRRVLVIALVSIVVLAAAAVGVWAWLSRGGPRPQVEVIVAEAPVKVGTEVLATVSKGDRLPVHGKRMGWYQVRAKGTLGWIQAAHIRRVRGPEAAPRPVQVEILGVYYPDQILGEFPRGGRRWLLVEVNAYAAEATGEGGAVVDTQRFALLRGKQRFFHPRVWKTFRFGDETVERLELRDQFVLPVGASRKLRLAYSVPSDVVARTGWHVVCVPPKTGDSEAASTADEG